MVNIQDRLRPSAPSEHRPHLSGRALKLSWKRATHIAGAPPKCRAARSATNVSGALDGGDIRWCSRLHRDESGGPELLTRSFHCLPSALAGDRMFIAAPPLHQRRFSNLLGCASPLGPLSSSSFLGANISTAFPAVLVLVAVSPDAHPLRSLLLLPFLGWLSRPASSVCAAS